MVQYKVVRVLTELRKLVMRPPNQLSAVTNESRLFRPQWIVNAQLGPIFLQLFWNWGKNYKQANTMILLLILFYCLISKNVSLIT